MEPSGKRRVRSIVEAPSHHASLFPLQVGKPVASLYLHQPRTSQSKKPTFSARAYKQVRSAVGFLTKMVKFEVWLECVHCEFQVLLNGDGLAVIFTDYAGRAI